MSFPSYYSWYIFPVFILLVSTLLVSLTKATSIHKTSSPIFIFTVIGILFWCVSMAYLGFSGFFETSTIPTGPVTNGIIIILGLSSYFIIKPFQRFMTSIPLQWMVLPQTFRILGGIFILATLQGYLPLYWGLSIGLGDVLTGIFAPFVAYLTYKKASGFKRYLVMWNLFGLLEVVHAIIIATLSNPAPFRLFYPHPGMEATQYPPLVLVTVVALPLMVLLHIFTLIKIKHTL